MIATGNEIKSTCVDATEIESTISLELKTGLSALELERRIAHANRAGDIGARALAFYLVDMAERGAQQQLGFHSVVQYAETRFGIRSATRSCTAPRAWARRPWPGLSPTRWGRCRRVSALVVKELGGMLGLLASLRDGDILFLDEVHRLPARIARSSCTRRWRTAS